jgi:hypothetical protein
VLLERAVGIVEVESRVERVERRLGDVADRRRARVTSHGDDLADERLARDHARELAAVGDQHRAHCGIRQPLARLLRAGRGLERTRLRNHRIADVLAHRRAVCR